MEATSADKCRLEMARLDSHVRKWEAIGFPRGIHPYTIDYLCNAFTGAEAAPAWIDSDQRAFSNARCAPMLIPIDMRICRPDAGRSLPPD